MFNNIVIHIDALYDTRTTVLQEITTQDQFVSILNAGYGNRQTDRFDSIISYHSFLKAYEGRDTKTLQSSTVSMIIPLVKSMLEDAMTAYLETPITKMPKLFIQIPPKYVLTEEDKLAMARLLIHHLELDIPIAFIEREIVTFRDLNNLEAGLYYIYDAVQWIVEMTTKFVIDDKMLSPGTVICCAKVHSSDTPYNLQALDRAAAVIKNEMSAICKLMFVPPSLFTSPLVVNPHLRPKKQSHRS